VRSGGRQSPSISPWKSAAVTETIEVSAAAPLLETETSTTGTVIKGDYFYKIAALTSATPGLFSI